MHEIDPQMVFKEICGSAAKSHLYWDMREHHPEGNDVWTRFLKDYFRGLAEQLPRDYDRRIPDREWLFDLCWTNGPRDAVSFKGVTLVMETEQGKSDAAVLEDLHKLLVVNAPTRVLIYTCHCIRTKNVQARRDLVLRAIREFGGIPSGELTAIMFADAATPQEYWTAYCDVFTPGNAEPLSLAPFRCMSPDWSLRNV
jgi:hypothetical protein